MLLLDDALEAPRCVISVMGAHAGEGTDTIFERKVADCSSVGRTLWVAKSPKARPQQVQDLCASGVGYVIFVEPATPGGARPTSESSRASEYSADRLSWSPLPSGLGPVTGQMDGAATALVLDQLTTDVVGAIDLWQYADAAAPDRPVRFKLGVSTLCAVRSDMAAHPNRMKSRYRGVVAVGRLAEPYCAWVR